MKKETALIPFQGTELVTVKINDVVYVAMKPIVESIGLDWNSQREKIKSDTRWGVITIPFQTKGGMQEMLSLDAYQLPAFLYSINPNKVRKDLRDRVIAFQKETFKVINEYWNNGFAINDNINFQKLIKAKLDMANGYKSQIAQKNRKIEDLQYEIDYLKSHPIFLIEKTFDDNVDYLILETEKELNNKVDKESLCSFYQKRANYFCRYVKFLRESGTELQKYTIQMIDQYRDEAVAEQNKRLKLQEKWDLINSSVKNICELTS